MYRFSTVASCLSGTGMLLALSMSAVAADLPALALSQRTDAARQADLEISRPGEVGIEVGVLTFVGTDLHLYYRVTDSPWMIGFRYLEYETDFISIDSDNTDREKQAIVGPFVRYLFAPGRAESLYFAGAMYEVTQEIECFDQSDEDSGRGLFFGGGLMGRRDGRVSYNIGLMFSPGLSLETDTGDCQSESNVGIDGVLSLVLIFN